MVKSGQKETSEKEVKIGNVVCEVMLFERTAGGLPGSPPGSPLLLLRAVGPVFLLSLLFLGPCIKFRGDGVLRVVGELHLSSPRPRRGHTPCVSAHTSGR